jgi:hypothetical protein
MIDWNKGDKVWVYGIIKDVSMRDLHLKNCDSATQQVNLNSTLLH